MQSQHVVEVKNSSVCDVTGRSPKKTAVAQEAVAGIQHTLGPC